MVMTRDHLIDIASVASTFVFSHDRGSRKAGLTLTVMVKVIVIVSVKVIVMVMVLEIIMGLQFFLTCVPSQLVN